MYSIVRVWPQCWQPVGGPWDRVWDFVALVWPIWSRVITTSSALVRCRNLLDGPSVGFRRYRSLPCIDTSNLIWTSRWMQEFTSGFKSAKWTVASGSMTWSRVPFASWFTISFPSMPQWLCTQQKRTRVSLSLNAQRRFMIWQIRGLSVPLPSIVCKQDGTYKYHVLLFCLSNTIKMKPDSDTRYCEWSPC